MAEEEVVERDYEAEASKEGWAPQDQWKGDPERWKTAEQFVKDGEKIVPILKSKVDRLESRVNEVLASNKKFNEFTQRSIAKEKKEKESLIRELEAAKAQAITDGDGVAAVKADNDIQELRTEVQPDRPDPLVEEWLGENQWYKTNDKLAIFADGIAERIVNEGYTGKAYFNELTRRVKEAHPNEFENKNRSKPQPVETSGEKAVDSNERTFDKLPPDAKKAYKEFKRDIPGFTKEQFVDQYDWE